MLELIITLLTNLLNKGFLILFFIGCLITLRHFILFLMTLREAQKPYTLDKTGLIYLGTSVAIILTAIISGFKLI